ncbi:methionine ABC transporter ATP-binding protein [Acidaminococcus fermentans]|uniref:D-methionine transport system ATP-binding protein n=1 Tax=Acidaminococcus fermentans TaxID=905 RepID=A0A1H2Z6X2_ACIFE|nr:methionine ABC transporter ATP-binding protein [Acidaminococcus fermentans]MDD7196023.1 methionine ABC transporter ATP-binding protein [Acidaminococcus fermentans]SDX12738.1 D-methionine transport system ATP-binding protein [Acidaminococcus fermentans]SFO50475.1 D-methionine transport system ATP-binding protein [Acidaminococcus fermentans]
MIELQHIDKIYHTSSGDLHALKDINLTINEGEIFGIIGLSGAGKSTLVRCINMLEKPTSGKVIVDGQEMTALGEEQLRKARQNIGMIFQHFNLLSSRTVFGNIAFPLEIQGLDKAAIQKKVEPLLDLVGLKDRADHYPSQLSGGQKQRVGIARALASDPKVLLCDEATSALDPQTTESILNLLRDINKRLHITIVMITHQMNVVKEICDRVAVIENGEIIEQGSMVDIFTNPQKATTREFVASIQHNDLPDFVRKLDIHKDYKAGDKALVSLSFIGDSAGEPIVSVLIKEYDTNVNILTANIENLQDTPFGTLLIEVEGDEAHLKKALDYLHERKVKDEVIGYVS